jgi:hypothetical protein
LQAENLKDYFQNCCAYKMIEETERILSKERDNATKLSI